MEFHHHHHQVHHLHQGLIPSSFYGTADMCSPPLSTSSLGSSSSSGSSSLELGDLSVPPPSMSMMSTGTGGGGVGDPFGLKGLAQQTSFYAPYLTSELERLFTAQEVGDRTCSVRCVCVCLCGRLIVYVRVSLCVGVDG